MVSEGKGLRKRCALLLIGLQNSPDAVGLLQIDLILKIGRQETERPAVHGAYCTKVSPIHGTYLI